MELIGHSVWKHTVVLLITKEENLNINDKAIEWLQRKCGNECLVFNKKKKTEAAQVMKELVDQAKIVAVQYDGEQNPMEEHRVMTEHNISEQQIMQGNGKKKNWLYKVRKSFAERVSKAVLSQLLNDLLEDGVLNEGEVESIEEEKSNLAKAFSFIDTVRKKGEKASKKLISRFQRPDGMTCCPQSSGAPDPKPPHDHLPYNGTSRSAPTGLWVGVELGNWDWNWDCTNRDMGGCGVRELGLCQQGYGWGWS
ncbi:hypothetical protein JZ751_022073 [Albula glossodonta]|uniref:CARD domain-containing protein n=1 Tax=Albula glossodonta TaxID=121402 RepID=A0A8T2MT13_9TELE|nr:hypothetical protein JZ751_022073 [Albula glossodonta]